jgi:hypothetical protein
MHKIPDSGNMVLNMASLTIKPYFPNGKYNEIKAKIEVLSNFDNMISSQSKFNLISNTSLKSEIYEISENTTELDRTGIMNNHGVALSFIKTNTTLTDLEFSGKNTF